MAGISTSINLNDGMTSVLHSMYSGINQLVGGFRDMQNSVNRGFNESAFNGFKQNMSSAIAQMAIMEREAQKAAQSAKNIFDWNKQSNFNIFGGDSNTRFGKEVKAVTQEMNSVLSAQKQVERQALRTELLPQKAVSDIKNTDKQIKNLISSMNQLKNVDGNSLSISQKNSLNTEYESIRKNVMALRQLQNDIILGSSKGDVSGINNSINQTKSIIEQTEIKLRSFRETLNQINSFSWQGINGIEVFNISGIKRAKDEINSAKIMTDKLIQTQQSLTSNALKMKMLPPNAVNEIQNINTRISGIRGTISNLEKEKSKLNRWNTAGINLYNNRIEALRQKLYEAEQAQKNINNAVKANDVERLNSAYRQLVSTIDRIDIDIRNNNTAQQQFNNSLSAGNTNANSLSNTISGILNKVKIYAGMALGGFGLKKAADSTDSFASLQARLGLITKSQAENVVLQNKLYESAQRTGSSYTDMVNTTAKLGLLAGNAFKNNAELSKFSELMAKSFKVSGASQQEQSAGMYQLTQAMASGRLQGDEFRSIIENAPMLAQAIEKYVGVGRQELRKMSKDGTITADVIKNALFAAGVDIEAKFAQMPKTFSWYFSEIKNSAFQSFGGLMQIISNSINSPGFISFIESIKNGIGGAAEWVTFRFYEFKSLFYDLYISAQPALTAIKNGFSMVRNSIFSANGVLGKVINSFSNLLQSSGFSTAIHYLSDMLLLFGNIASSIIGFITSLFGNFGGVLMGVIVAVKTFNIVNRATQGILRTVCTIVQLFTTRTISATTALGAETAAANGAKMAHAGLNTVLKANPFALVASAIAFVISLFYQLSSAIDEVNAKTGGEVGGVGSRSKYDMELIADAKKRGVDATDSAQIFSERDMASSEIKRIEKNKKGWEDKTGITELKNKSTQYEAAVMTGKIKTNSQGTYALIPGLGKVTESEYKGWQKRIKNSDVFTSATYDFARKNVWSQYETEKYKIINDARKRKADLAQAGYDADTAQKVVEEAMKNMPQGEGGAGAGTAAGDSGKADKVDVGTVDKVKDTVDVTDEDLKFMRDFAERDIINKIHNNTIAPQINVEFSGEIKETADVNKLIGKVTEILSSEINNSAAGVHI